MAMLLEGLLMKLWSAKNPHFAIGGIGGHFAHFLHWRQVGETAAADITMPILGSWVLSPRSAVRRPFSSTYRLAASPPPLAARRPLFGCRLAGPIAWLARVESKWKRRAKCQ